MGKKQTLSLNTSSLALFGLMDRVYDMYLCMRDFCNEQVEKNKVSHHQDYPYTFENETNSDWIHIDIHSYNVIKEMCRERFRQFLYEFCNENFEIFANNNPAEAIKDLNLYAFWFMDHKDVRHTVTDKDGNTRHVFGIRAYCISFSRFIQYIEYFIVRAILSVKQKTDKRITEDEVFEEVDFRIGVVAKVKREKYITECAEETREPAVLYVFSSLHSITCNLNNHIIEPYECTIPLLAEAKQITIPAHRCKECEKVFIGEQTLKEYVKEYGWLFARRISDNSSPEYSWFALESKLHSLGYNVVEGEMTTQKRRQLLELLIQRKAITYFEACRDIENAINMFCNRRNFASAVEKWRSDLRFIGDLQLDKGTNH